MRSRIRKDQAFARRQRCNQHVRSERRVRSASRHSLSVHILNEQRLAGNTANRAFSLPDPQEMHPSRSVRVLSVCGGLATVWACILVVMAIAHARRCYILTPSIIGQAQITKARLPVERKLGNAAFRSNGPP